MNLDTPRELPPLKTHGYDIPPNHLVGDQRKIVPSRGPISLHNPTEAQNASGKIRDYLPWSIVNTIVGVLLLGIIALALSMQVRKYLKSNSFEEARKYSKRALLSNIGGTLMGLVIWGIVIYYIVSTVTAVNRAANSYDG
jgi:hypothetical protein